MNKIYNPSYPCKVISSFYDNYYDKHEYDLIKRIILRKEDLNNDLKIEIYNYFLIFNMIFTIYKPLNNISLILKYYNYVFKELDKRLKIFLKNKKLNFDDIPLLFELLKICNSSNAFLLFLLITLIVNDKYGYSCVLPCDIIKTLNNINDDDIKSYFIKSYFNSLYHKERIDIKLEIINYLNKLKSELKDIGIISIYLYGSIMNDEYSDSSDIDLVVRYDSLKIEKIKTLNNKIKTSLQNKFRRNVDIHEYNDFILIRDISMTIKIF